MSYEEEKQDRKIEQLEAEIEWLRSLNPFGADVRVGMRIRDNAFAYSDGEGAAVLQNSLLAKDSRIKELEEALAEYQRLGKTIAGKVPCLALHGDCGRCSAKMREVCGALEQIAGGKIGPDVKPRSWQVTDARKAALSRAYDVISWIDRVDSDNQKHIDVLQDMLAEATR